jgi:hypothetical protein
LVGRESSRASFQFDIGRSLFLPSLCSLCFLLFKLGFLAIMETPHTNTPAPATAGDFTNLQPSEPAAAPPPPARFSTPPLPPDARPDFDRLPGESARAFGAFLTFFQLGFNRCLQAVADKLGEPYGTVRNWSSKFDWAYRIQSFNMDLLHQQAQATTNAQLHHTTDWAKRLDRLREKEWEVAQQLRVAAQCFLESFGDEEVRRMTLAQAGRALRIASQLSRCALAGADLPPSPDAARSTAHQQFLDAIQRAYSQPAPNREPATPQVPPDAQTNA